MEVIDVDFEIFSEVDVTKVGLHNYVTHPSTDIICMAFSQGHGVTKLWRPGRELPKFPAQYVLRAHNAPFEKAVIEFIGVPKYGMHMPQKKYDCTAARAAYMTYPRSLENVSKALRLPLLKDKEGRGAMLQVTKPRTPSKNNPHTTWFHDKERMNKVYRYCIQDVDVEHHVHEAVINLPPFEEKVFALDMEINQRGVYVDEDLVDAAISIAEQNTEELNNSMFWVTGCRVSATTKTKQIKTYLNDVCGLNLPSITKDIVRDLLEGDAIPDRARRILELRQKGSKTSVAKFYKIKAWMTLDKRIRHLFMYCGASTARWTGKGPQLHNLPRGLDIDKEKAIALIKRRKLVLLQEEYADPMAILSSCIRETFMAAPGYTLIAGDFSSIEVRVLAWLAGQQDLIDMLDAGEDPYIDMASAIYKVEKTDVDSNQRLIGKIAVLGLGYGMGWKTFQAQCGTYGVQITEKFAKLVVKTYRAKYTKIVQFWKTIEETMLTALTCGEERNGKLLVTKHERNLKFHLPSGRDLWYIDVGTGQNRWHETCLTHMTVDATTKQWVRRETYGGMLTENIVQAIARDLLAEAMLRVDEFFNIVIHVHDEAVIEIPLTDAKSAMPKFKQLMQVVPGWAKGCPIAVKLWSQKRFMKD